MWGWYHSDLGVPEVLTQVGANLGPEDGNALLVLLDGVLEKRSTAIAGQPLQATGTATTSSSGLASGFSLPPAWPRQPPVYLHGWALTTRVHRRAVRCT